MVSFANPVPIAVQRSQQDEVRLVDTFREEIDFLRLLPMFTHLQDLELGRLCQVASVHRYPPGTVILSEGQVNDSLYIIRSGYVELYRRTSNGEPFLQLGRGRFFGQVSMFDPAPSSATVVAQSDVEVMCLRERSLCDLLIAHPDVGVHLLAAIIRDLAKRHHTILKQVRDIAPQTLESGRAHL